ncbi:MAG: hypothetical protein HKN05_20375 [Rhizobiales bacterium]|nr:hypothetical protein [Hyphomicrobiales bacterium]
MGVIIDEVISEVVRPAPASPAATAFDQPPGDAKPAEHQVLMMLRRAEYRARRLSAD